MSVPYAELAVATNFSFLRGASHPQEYVEQAVAYGLSAIGIADRNTVAGLVRAYAAARVKPEGLRDRSRPETWRIRFLPGVRLVTEEGFEAVTYPMDRAAYGRLCRLLSAGNRRARKGACRFAFAEMLEAAEGQIFIAMPPGRRLTPPEGFAARLEALAAAAPGRTYLGGAHVRRGDERRRLGLLAELGERLGAPLVAVSDALYHHPDRRPFQDVVTCIREGCRLTEAGYRLEANAERHLKPGHEMARLFADHPEAVRRTLEIAQACGFSLGELTYEYPDEPVPPGRTAQEYLEAKTFERAAWRFPDGLPPGVEATLREELRLIARMDYARYFLTLFDLVEFARSRGILCQGRGSAANSAVCYCLGITAVDPAKHRLLFARFISENRNEPPDIDVDFEHERREEVIQYLYAKYGRERAAICSTVIHYRPRSAIREVGKVLGLTEDITAALSETVWGSWGKDLPDSHVTEAGLDPGNPAIRQAVDLAVALIGFPRHLSQHVGGFVLTRARLDETVPVCNAAMPDRTFIEWDKDDIDVLDLMKVDVLALGMLSCLKRGLDFLERDYGASYPTLADLPQEDAAVYAMLSRADSVGVFQVESRAQMSMLPRLRPREFYDLVVQVAIVRPGPIQGDMVHPYLRRRAGAEPVDYPAPHPDHGPADELESVLSRTYGVPLFQEHAMQIAITAAGFTPAEADGLRRAMATFRHVGTIGVFEEKFVGGMTGRGYPRDFAERCFAQIRGFSTYGFPESHAASFALLVYASAWMKCRHPDVFLAAILNAQPMGFYQPAQLVRDARAHGVEVRGPDVNASDWDCTLEPAAEAPPPGVPRRLAVRIGLRQVSGLPEAAMRRLVAVRGNGYASIEGLQAALALPRNALERLAEADAFRSLDLDRRAALWMVRTLEGTSARRAAKAAAEAGPDRRAHLLETPLPLFAFHADDGLFRHEPAVALPAMPPSEQVAEDYVSTGLSLRGHPIAFFRERLARIGAIPARDHGDEALPPNSRVTVAGLVLTRQRPGTAKGVVFLTIEDETGIANVIVWRKVFEANRRAAMTARFLAVRGRVQREGSGEHRVVHVIAERFRDLTDELRALREGGVRLPAETNDFGAPLDRRVYRSRDFH
ncbi:error-prone DNA polymerase [Methylobacterium oxalidis]|uniref:Error-prone DNA polymerase n=1 Tax=Methylobacterium oxalidis TaxID=944322 RepID=A0A512J2F6_9HYPH|nr:error-prone DNA polymerase [Methylobacterium oxalidis]GEP04144.1 error-prone DNA polymerase [Methylobacterium oxalidis]GJE35269.1 Error-prone DNA polymerase [Methylobacterium oxalidis]GLS65027.1 error-prone DNA polymerase [Methylobacterium oxalidis]